MSPHFVLSQLNGKTYRAVEMSPAPQREFTLKGYPGRYKEGLLGCVVERFELTEEQAKLSIDALTVMASKGELKKWQPGEDSRDANTKAIEKQAKAGTA